MKKGVEPVPTIEVTLDSGPVLGEWSWGQVPVQGTIPL